MLILPFWYYEPIRLVDKREPEKTAVPWEKKYSVECNSNKAFISLFSRNAPLWKIIKYGKNLALKNEQKHCPLPVSVSSTIRTKECI